MSTTTRLLDLISRVHKIIFYVSWVPITIIIYSHYNRDLWYMTSFSYGVLLLTGIGERLLRRGITHIDASYRTATSAAAMTLLWLIRWAAVLWIWLWVGFAGMSV
jgi:hypothetical protein